jgi:hypothetical protein
MAKTRSNGAGSKPVTKRTATRSNLATRKAYSKKKKS